MNSKAIPLGSALIPVEQPGSTCDGCFFFGERGELFVPNKIECLVCTPDERGDGKNVIYKLIEMKKE